MLDLFADIPPAHPTGSLTQLNRPRFITIGKGAASRGNVGTGVSGAGASTIATGNMTWALRGVSNKPATKWRRHLNSMFT